MNYDVIVIGAGISGLAALKELTAAGYQCCLLEASSRAGGRIYTLEEEGFEGPVECGAEFIHGKLPLTIKLLNDAGIKYEPVEGKMIAVHKGNWLKNEEHDEDWPIFMKQLDELGTDMSIGGFLDKFFSSDQYKDLRNAVRNFAEGFDLADISRVSAFSLRKEWKHENDMQFRIKGGYVKLVNWLLDECRPMTSELVFSSPVTKIEYKKNMATVHTASGRYFEGSKVIISLSPAALLQESILFDPIIDGLNNALKQGGFGSVIKFLLQFNSAFWKPKEKELGFLLSDEVIPTWWTQYPEANNLLTGWLGGPRAEQYASRSDEELLEMAIQSLSSIFHLASDLLRKELKHHKIMIWQNQPFICGGYSYETLYSAPMKRFFSQPVHDTLYFIGEAYSRNGSPGTVEAALETATSVVQQIMAKD